MRVFLRLFVVVIASAALLAGCATTPVKRAIKAGPVASGGTGWIPDTVRVHKGDKVDLTVGNGGDKTHGFSIDAYNVKDTVEVGKPKHIKFTARTAGEFVIYCQLHPAHKKANLIVS